MNNKAGFSLLEMLTVLGILSIMMGGVYMTFTTGQGALFETDAQIELQENLRFTLERIAKELRESGDNSVGTMQVTIGDNTGANATDTLRFAMPIICQAGTSIIDANGDVANWGAPLNWGCTDSSCMDADDDCATIDYRWIDYVADVNNNLLRQVIDNGGNAVRTDQFAENITNFQITLSGSQNIITLVVTATKTTATNRQVTASSSLDVFLNNRG